MSSILTNSSAMVALDTLRGINGNLEQVQSEISTGKKINSSTDNAAIWSISTVMQSDVDSFGMISDSLNLGSATVGVAQAASEEVTSLLQSARETIVAANDASITDEDRTKYNTDLTEIKASIASIVESASFNGQNLLKAGDAVSVLSSLNRQADGTVTTGNIDVARQDLSTSEGVAVVADAATDAAFDNTSVAVNDGTDDGTSVLTIKAGAATAATTYEFEVAGQAVSYTSAIGDDEATTATAIQAAIDTAIGASTGSADLSTALDVSGTDATITISNSSLTEAYAVTDPTVATDVGGLSGLNDLEISDIDGATAALTAIDSLLQSAIDATAFFGSKQSRIETQNEFVTTLSDSLTTGIGALTDANLEEASARLQSLQVQQQLGIQALSIANSSPQQLLSLFQ